jgi:PhoH-like ATPase
MNKTPYTGVRVVSVEKGIIDSFYQNKEIDIWGDSEGWSQNLYVVLKDEVPKEQGGSASAIGRVKGNKIVLVKNLAAVGNLKPKNKEQIMALDALMDDDIKVVVLTGQAGVGKTLVTLAAAISKIESKKYNKIIVSKNTVSVGKELGFLPGGLDEKFTPFNQGILCNVEYLLGGQKKAVPDAISQYKIEFIPTAIVRGSSWHNSFVIVDEAQNLSPHELLTVGTRISEGSKLILLGDLNQIDVRMKKDATGLYRFVNSSLVRDSTFVSYIHLIKNERSEVSKLFSSVFG